MVTDNYCDEYYQRQVNILFGLMQKATPHYNQMEMDKEHKVTLSCDGCFKRTFSSIERAIKELKNANNR